ncbi:MAG: hypothetical protein CMF51_02065 [Legionellales bacterium]|nr:hypothetical protein [Legionellales bacterium]
MHADSFVFNAIKTQDHEDYINTLKHSMRNLCFTSTDDLIQSMDQKQMKSWDCNDALYQNQSYINPV